MFRRLFEHSPDAIWLLDTATGVFVDVNAEAMALMGETSREASLMLEPRKVFIAVGGTCDRCLDGILEGATSGRGRMECEVRRRDGTRVAVEVLTTLMVEDGRPLAMLTVRDLTERWCSEAALREQQELLASVTDNLREAVFRSNAEHRLTFVNAAWLRLFRFESMESACCALTERLFARASQLARLIEMIQRDRRIVDEEVEFVRKDGTHFWGLFSSRAVLEPGGKRVAYHVGSIVDITERRRVDAELRASEERFRRLFEDSADAMAMIDPSTSRFLDVNRALLVKLGYERKEQLIGKSAASAAPSQQPDGQPSNEGAAAAIRRALQEGSIRTEWMACRADGSEMPIETVLTTIQSGGRPILFSVSRDITERKRAEASLKQLNASLEELVAERTGALQVSNQLLRDEIVERQRRVKVEHALFRIAEAIHQAADVPQLYPLLHEAVGELMPARNFFIALHEPATDLHEFVYHRDEMDPPPPPRRLGAGLTAHVFRTGKTLLLNRAAMTRGVELSGQMWKVEHGTPSAVWLGAPLVAQGRILGVMAVQDYHDERAFGVEEKRLLTFVAEQAALAIERKRADQALRDSEERHRALFEGTSQGVMLHDSHRIVAVNTTACRIHGYESPADMIGKHPSETSAPTQPGGIPSAVLAARHIEAAFQQGQTRFEWMARHKEGHDVPIEVLLTRIKWGKDWIIQAVIHEIAERKRRENVERALYRISESIHEACDLEHLYPLIHQVVSELMPARNFFIALRDPATGWVEFPYWRDQQDPAPPARPEPRGLTGQVMHLGRGLLVRRDDFASAVPVDGGSRFDRLGITVQVGCGSAPFIWLGVPLIVQGHTLGAMVLQDYENERAYGEEEQRILGFIAEQTALAIGRKRADDAIRDSEARHRTLYRISEAVHVSEDLSHLYQLIHQAVSEVMPARNFYIATLDPSGESVTFPYWSDERDPAPGIRPAHVGVTGIVLKTGEPKRFHPKRSFQQRREGDRTFHVYDGVEIEMLPAEHYSESAVYLGVPLLSRGQTLGVMAVQDYVNELAYGPEEERFLTFVAEQTVLAIERKKSEQELRRALEREQELGRMKSSFTSLVSHEFRTPLGVIASSAEILRDYFDRLEPGERVEHLDTITKHTRRMGALMEEVLLLSRFDADRTEFRAEPVDLDGFCRRITDEVLSATHHRCPMSLEVSSDMPAALLDERLLRHVLTNLLVNAAKYSEPGSPVCLRVSRSNNEAVFEVCDRGIGIPEADRAWLFHAFQRGSNVGARPGTGLGLVIVKRCVDLHQGTIDIESTVGLGTIIRVRLPVFKTATAGVTGFELGAAPGAATNRTAGSRTRES